MEKYNSENEFQNRLFTSLVKHELQYKDLFIYHVPNGGFRDKITAKILQLIGLRAGVSDLHILGGGKMLFVELKKSGKHSQSDMQIVFEQKIKANGFTYMLVYPEMGVDNIVKSVIEYLYG
jgi:hypothetical protein